MGEVEEAMKRLVIDDMIKEYKKHDFELKTLMYGERKGGVTDEMVVKAKEYPFSELLGTERKSVRCPFHEDRHPSASVKDNKLHCFVCNKSWDTIDYIMEKEELAFQEAVRRLI